jgi:hypothetical protein
MHFERELPASIAAGVVRSKDLKVEIVTTVGGREVRNKLWGTPLRTYEVPFPNMRRTDDDFKEVELLWDALDGSIHTFNFFDEISGELVRVRFDGQLQATHEAGPWWRYETLHLIEVRA